MTMNSVELLEKSIRVARSQGYVVRFDPLEGIEGGLCRIGERFHIFLDQTLSAREQLDILIAALSEPSATGTASVRASNFS